MSGTVSFCPEINQAGGLIERALPLSHNQIHRRDDPITKNPIDTLNQRGAAFIVHTDAQSCRQQGNLAHR